MIPATYARSTFGSSDQSGTNFVWIWIGTDADVVAQRRRKRPYSSSTPV